MNKRLFVAGLPFSSTEDDVRQLFSQVGNVISVSIITDKMSGRSKGFGFVEMDTEEEAGKAVQTLHDSEFGGRKLVVAEAKPQERRESGGRNDGRGWGGGRGNGDRRGFGRPGGGNRRFGGRRDGGNRSGSGFGRNDRGRGRSF